MVLAEVRAELARRFGRGISISWGLEEWALEGGGGGDHFEKPQALSRARSKQAALDLKALTPLEKPPALSTMNPVKPISLNPDNTVTHSLKTHHSHNFPIYSL